MTKQMQKRQDSSLTKETATRVSAMITKNKQAIVDSLPKGFDCFNRMQRNIINAISTNYQLAECTPESLFLSSVQAFACGLEIGGVQGYAHLVPFWNGKKKCKEAKFMPDYKGLIDVARRSGEIKLAYAEKVCQDDVFIYERGTDPKLDHNPDVFGDRGEVTGYYAVVVFKDGTKDFEAMSLAEIQKVAETSSTFRDGQFRGPWADHFDEMAKKTVLKRLLKRCPMQIDIVNKAIHADNAVSMGSDEDLSNVIDVPGIVIDEEDRTTTETMQQRINEEAKSQLKTKINKKKPTETDGGHDSEGWPQEEYPDGDPLEEEYGDDQIPDLEPTEAPKPKPKVTNTALLAALSKTKVPDPQIKDYLVASKVIKAGQKLEEMPENWKRRIVEEPAKIRKEVADWLDASDE